MLNLNRTKTTDLWNNYQNNRGFFCSPTLWRVLTHFLQSHVLYWNYFLLNFDWLLVSLSVDFYNIFFFMAWFELTLKTSNFTVIKRLWTYEEFVVLAPPMGRIGKKLALIIRMSCCLGVPSLVKIGQCVWKIQVN